MKAPRLFRCLNIALLIVAGAAGGITFWPVSPVRESARRSVASSNLRQIGQASLIYASERRDKLPEAENIWDYAGELARVGGLNDATIWVMGTDPANVGATDGLSTVLTRDGMDLTSDFRKLVPSWAVPLGGLTMDMPSTTPIGWTRGLRQDGTWAPHNPFGGEGGHIVFLGGNVTYFRNVKDALHRFDGTGMTSNILEALPPGTRIGEYVPNATEARRWAETLKWMGIRKAVRPVIGPALWMIVLVVLIVQVARKRWPLWLLVWFLVLSFLAAIVTPTAGRVREF